MREFGSGDDLSGAVDNAVVAAVAAYQQRRPGKKHRGNARLGRMARTAAGVQEDGPEFGIGLGRRKRPVGEDQIRLAPGHLSEAMPAGQNGTGSPEAMSEKSQVLNLAAQSNVIISALDARGLYTTNLDASQRGPSSPLALATSNQSDYHSSAMNLSEDVMAEFAEGTGGTFFHNSNDLAGGLQRLTALPECVYILELSLANVKSDGAYHSLKVKVDRDAISVQARRGYFAPRPHKN